MTIHEALNSPDSHWLTIQETARRLGLSEAQVRQRISTGELHAERVFGRVAVLEASVAAYALPKARA